MTGNRALTVATTGVLLALIAIVIGGNWLTETERVNAQQPRASQASIQRFTLNEMVDRAGRIFRGTVISAEPGVIAVGGGSLPTVQYRFRVDHVFKGDFPSKDGVAYAEVTMLGSPKTAIRSGQYQKLNAIPAPTLLAVGSDHLMLLTPEGASGLSAPVGLGQGNFEIFEQDKTEFAKNEFNNLGIFDGPVTYSRLAEEISKRGGNR